MWSLRDLPLSKGVDVRQELVDFHDRHYRASAMQLVVLGRQSLDELQQMVVTSFSDVAPAKASAAGKGVVSDTMVRDGWWRGGGPEGCVYCRTVYSSCYIQSVECHLHSNVAARSARCMC